jgi:hypothetical protein
VLREDVAGRNTLRQFCRQFFEKRSRMCLMVSSAKQLKAELSRPGAAQISSPQKCACCRRLSAALAALRRGYRRFLIGKNYRRACNSLRCWHLSSDVATAYQPWVKAPSKWRSEGTPHSASAGTSQTTASVFHVSAVPSQSQLSMDGRLLTDLCTLTDGAVTVSSMLYLRENH